MTEIFLSFGCCSKIKKNLKACKKMLAVRHVRNFKKEFTIINDLHFVVVITNKHLHQKNFFYLLFTPLAVVPKSKKT
jgi:hypothetical protein